MADQEVLRMTEGGLFIDMILTLKNEKKKECFLQWSEEI